MIAYHMVITDIEIPLVGKIWLKVNDPFLIPFVPEDVLEDLVTCGYEWGVMQSLVGWCLTVNKLGEIDKSAGLNIYLHPYARCDRRIFFITCLPVHT